MSNSFALLSEAPAEKPERALVIGNSILRHVKLARPLGAPAGQQCHRPHPCSEPWAHEEYQSIRCPWRSDGIGPASSYVFTVEARAIGFSLPGKATENYCHSCLTLRVTLHYAQESLVVLALVYYRLAVNLIDHHLMEELHLHTLPCETPLRVMAVDICPIGKGLIM
ncbi:hypothetical protein QTP70_011773 [Hemibagrus guttatus]|uniref:Uncharacterized protein n=1 Tax=Hemibagrus guttatus TaxID=175788 RepID=A0AAE0QMW1_9TELE|nr:hypothetical protein QTP70_011773 [Hemibagrus guttatus]